MINVSIQEVKESSIMLKTLLFMGVLCGYLFAGITATDGTYTDKVVITSDTELPAGAIAKVYRATSAGGAKTYLGSTNTESYSDTTGEVLTVYYYFVKVCIGTSCSGYSDYDTGYRVPFLAPEDVDASFDSYSDKILVTYAPVSGASYYEVYRSTSTNVSGAELIGNSSLDNFPDSTATPGIYYYYWVKACTADYKSDYSSYARGRRYIHVDASKTSTYAVYIEIKEPIENVSVYVFYRALSPDGDKTQIGYAHSGDNFTPVFQDTNVIPGQLYYYFARACYWNNCSNSSPYSGYDTGYRILSTPTDINATDGLYSDKVVISNYALENAHVTNYKIWRSPTGYDNRSLIGETTLSSFDDTEALPEVVYYYTVQACSIYTGCSEFSEYTTGYKKKAAPIIPAILMYLLQ